MQNLAETSNTEEKEAEWKMRDRKHNELFKELTNNQTTAKWQNLNNKDHPKEMYVKA